MQRPSRTAGLRHVALFVEKLEDCVAFYTNLLGMTVEWQPDADNYYLTSGNDNLALHRWTVAEGATTGAARGGQRLDHIGFIIDRIDDVDAWHEFLVAHAVRIVKTPKTHRDGARSFYCADPDGTLVQIIFHPPISAGK
jgi:catechol 2,3-dioxygenase-like lactoylglutathione lyase family enzyme